MNAYVWHYIRDWVWARLPKRYRRLPIMPKPLLEWDVAAETGEFTHILKDGVHTISVTPARDPT